MTEKSVFIKIINFLTILTDCLIVLTGVLSISIDLFSAFLLELYSYQVLCLILIDYVQHYFLSPLLGFLTFALTRRGWDSSHPR